jgi:hypothetical protein
MATEVVWWLMRIEVLRHKTSNASRVIGKRLCDRQTSNASSIGARVLAAICSLDQPLVCPSG